jgi:hypothetical protein
MTTDRGQHTALTRLVDLQGAGGFTLPADLLAATDLPNKVRNLPVPEVTDDLERVAADLFNDLRAGRPVDVEQHAARVAEADAARARREHAQTLLALAQQHAVTAAALAATDASTTVITDVLQPVYTDLLASISGHAKNLDGHPLDDRSLITAPDKVRKSWAALRDLAAQHTALRHAWDAARRMGGLEPQHDGRGDFVAFSNPFVLNGHKPDSTARPAVIEAPTDPVMHMLWLVGPAKPAQPWLPTVAEQDQRWLQVYGPSFEQRRRTAQALSFGTMRDDSELHRPRVGITRPTIPSGDAA